MGWLMGLEPKRPGNEGIVMGRLYEGNRPLRHPHDPRIYPWIYPTQRFAPTRQPPAAPVSSPALASAASVLTGCVDQSPRRIGALTLLLPCGGDRLNVF